MKIALDYDGTYTSDPAMWRAVITAMQVHGHDVRIVTMRFPSECAGSLFDAELIEYGLKIIATSRTAKRPFCERAGWVPDVWIDDIPEAISNDAATLWPGSNAQEGAPIVPHYK